MESILTSIKKLLGITEEYEHFDTDIIIHINSVFATLNQLGVGPSEGFSIKDKNSTWVNFIGEKTNFENIKTYVYYKVKLIFDPPLSTAHITAMKEVINELEWRIQVEADPIPQTGTTTPGNSGSGSGCCDDDCDCDCVDFLTPYEVREIMRGY